RRTQSRVSNRSRQASACFLRRRTCSKAAKRIAVSRSLFSGRRSLPIERPAISRLVCLLLAHIGAALRAPVPALAFQVIDAARQVEPHDGVSGTMLLSLLLRAEQRKGPGRVADNGPGEEHHD